MIGAYPFASLQRVAEKFFLGKHNWNAEHQHSEPLGKAERVKKISSWLSQAAEPSETK